MASANAQAAARPQGRGDLRERILDAAHSLFRTKGYADTSVADIAAKVGLTGPALYYYFGSKSNLLFEALHSPMERQVQLCREAIAGRQPPEQLYAFVEALVLSLLENPALRDIRGDAFVSMGLLVLALPAQQQEEVQALVRGHVRDLREILKAGVRESSFRDVDPAATAFAVLGMAENVTWFRPGGRMSRAAVAALYADFAVSMVTARD